MGLLGWAYVDPDFAVYADSLRLNTGVRRIAHMGLDGTIKRPDGQSIGTFAQVQGVLADIFSGVVLQRSLSGLEKLQTAEAQGITFPTILRKHMASTPAKYEGDYAGADFSIEFYADAADILPKLAVSLRGTTTHAEPLFTLLKERHGWILTHP